MTNASCFEYQPLTGYPTDVFEKTGIQKPWSWTEGSGGLSTYVPLLLRVPWLLLDAQYLHTVFGHLPRFRQYETPAATWECPFNKSKDGEWLGTGGYLSSTVWLAIGGHTPAESLTLSFYGRAGEVVRSFPFPLLALCGRRSPTPTISYWYREHRWKARKEERLPVLFVHRIGVGLHFYLLFFRELIPHYWDACVGLITLELLLMYTRIT